MDFPGGSDGKVSAYNAGDPSSIPGSGRSPWRRKRQPTPYSCLENPMDRGAWQTIVHGVTKSRTRLSDFTSSLHALRKAEAKIKRFNIRSNNTCNLYYKQSVNFQIYKEFYIWKGKFPTKLLELVGKVIRDLTNKININDTYLYIKYSS